MVRRFLLAVALVGLQGASAADDDAARRAVEEALQRQAEAPGYVEHLFGRAPLLPTATDQLAQTLGDEVTARAQQAVRERVLQATSAVPEAATAADRALIGMMESAGESDEVPGVVLGPERELATIEHTGAARRERYAGGVAEVVFADGQQRTRVDLSAQVAQLRAIAAGGAVEPVVSEVSRIKTTIQHLDVAFLQGGAFGVVLSLIAQLDEALSLIYVARSTAQLLEAANEMAQMSNTWRCVPDPDAAAPAAPMVDVQRLDDAVIAGETVEVYRYDNVFAVEPEDGEAELADAEQVTTETRVFVRATDGLPLRREVTLPGGQTQWSEYEYSNVATFTVPDCGSSSSAAAKHLQ